MGDINFQSSENRSGLVHVIQIVSQNQAQANTEKTVDN